MFIKNLKDFNNFKEDVIYVWNDMFKFCFVAYDNIEKEWVISYIDNEINLMSVIINQKGELLKGDGALYDKMKEDNLSEKEMFFSLMEVLEYQFNHINYYKEKKESVLN